MIDLHTHLIPGLDDGAFDLKHALDMAQAAVEDGICAAAATPHWIPGVYENTRRRVLSTVERFGRILEEEGIPLRVHPGAELHLDPSIPEGVDGGELLTFNDAKRYALIELPSVFVPEQVEGFFFSLRARGIRPVAAHPERCPTVVRRPEILDPWVRSGVLVQITAASLLGGFGPEVRKLCRRLLRRGLVHVIASDSHGLHDRPPRLSEAREAAAEIVGHEAARAMVEEVPRCILEGEEVTPPVELEENGSRKRWWSRLWGGRG